MWGNFLQEVFPTNASPLVLHSLAQDVAVFLIKAFKIAAVEGFADLAGKVVIEIEIMRNSQGHANRLLGFEQVANVRTAVIFASGALAARIDRAVVKGVFFVGEVHFAVPSEDVAMARVTGGHDAIEEVHTVVDSFENIARRTNAHQVARLVLGHVRLDCIDNAIHILGLLAYGKTANGVPFTGNLGDHLHVFNAQILIGAALVDAEEHLVAVDGVRERVETVHLLAAANQPTVGALHALLAVLVRCRVCHTLVKRHRDGGSKVGLNLHAFLGSHKNTGTVEVRAELYALLGNLAQLGKGENLKSAAVGKNGAFPVHKLAKSSHLADEPVTRTDVQMVGVGELDLAVDLFELHGIDAALDGTAGAYVHKDGRLNVAVHGVQHTAARATFGL